MIRTHDKVKETYETYKWISSLVDDQAEDLLIDESQLCNNISETLHLYFI